MSVRRIDLEYHIFLVSCTGFKHRYFSCEEQAAIEDAWVRLSAEDASSHAWKEGRQSKHHHSTFQGGNFISPQPEMMWQRSSIYGSFSHRWQRTLGCPKGLKVLGQWEVLLQPFCEGHPWLLANRRRNPSPELIDLQDMDLQDQKAEWQKPIFGRGQGCLGGCAEKMKQIIPWCRVLCAHFKTYRHWLIAVIF